MKNSLNLRQGLTSDSETVTEVNPWEKYIHNIYLWTVYIYLSINHKNSLRLSTFQWTAFNNWVDSLMRNWWYGSGISNNYEKNCVYYWLCRLNSTSQNRPTLNVLFWHIFILSDSHSLQAKTKNTIISILTDSKHS